MRSASSNRNWISAPPGRVVAISWSFDEHYDLFEADTAGNILRRLTNAPGYDAEGSWSPDGAAIVFVSNRHAYVPAALTDDEQAAFAKDPSVFMDLYSMDADGSNVRRLTTSSGYDGGPFFNADGSRIVWRRFEPKGHVAEIWTMNPDGSDQRQITRMGVMSWAPFFHPSGDYIIFANNAHGYGNFELYLVDTAGQREPVRVTDSAGFDGLPVFTPDGGRLAWASSRTSDKKPQLFIAEWDDAKARALLGLEPADGHGSADMAPVRVPLEERTTAAITEDDLRLHVGELASERMAGRVTGTDGARLATDYVAPLLGDAGGTPLTLDRDWRPLAFSGSGAVESAGLMFAGYGILAPGEGAFAAYGSYQGLDVTDKWVLVFRYLPEDVMPEHRQYLNEYADLRFKAMIPPTR